MQADDDPYQILGVPETATAAEIRTAYRRLAVQHHPDKQRTVQDKERVTPLFVKISNAYELLSDPEERAQYDQRQQQQPAAAAAASYPNNYSNHHFAFHDPFQVFDQLFRSQMQGSMFPPSMFGGNVFGMNAAMNMNMNMNMGIGTAMNMGDPFMSGAFGGFPVPPFGNFMSPLGMMNNPLASGDSASMMTFSSSSGSYPGAQAVSVSTTTRIVNGRSETRTERIIRHADGTTERIIETPDALLNPELQPRIAQLPDTPEVSSDTTLSSTESSSKRKTPTNVKPEPKKRRKMNNSPKEGDPDKPIVLE